MRWSACQAQAVLQLAKKVEFGGLLPGRHMYVMHCSHRRKGHAHHVNFLLQCMCESGSQVPLDWMRVHFHVLCGDSAKADS